MDDLIEKCEYCKMKISDMNPGDWFVRDKDGLKYGTYWDSYTHKVVFQREGDPMHDLPLYLFDEDETVLPLRLSKETRIKIRDNKMVDISGNISIQNIYKRIYGYEFKPLNIFPFDSHIIKMENIIYLLQEFKLIEAKYKFDDVNNQVSSTDLFEDFKNNIDTIFDIKVKWTTSVKEILDFLQEEIQNQLHYAYIFYERKEEYGDLNELEYFLRKYVSFPCDGNDRILYLDKMFQRAENFGIQFKQVEFKEETKSQRNYHSANITPLSTIVLRNEIRRYGQQKFKELNDWAETVDSLGDSGKYKVYDYFFTKKY